MTITRVGTNEKYADGWSKAFGGAKKAKAAPAQNAAAKSSATKVAETKTSATKAGTVQANSAKSGASKPTAAKAIAGKATSASPSPAKGTAGKSSPAKTMQTGSPVASKLAVAGKSKPDTKKPMGKQAVVKAKMQPTAAATKTKSAPVTKSKR